MANYLIDLEERFIMKILLLILLPFQFVFSAEDYKPGDQVLFKDTMRTVEAVDNTGRIVLQRTTGYFRSYTTNQEITKIVPSFDDYKPGDQVLFKDTMRTVEAVDNTGRIVLQRTTGYFRTYTTNKQIKKIDFSPEDLKQECAH